MIDMLLAAEPASAPVTQWPLRILLVLVVLAVIALVLVGMRRGWLRRARAPQAIPAPPLPADAADVPRVCVAASVTSGGSEDVSQFGHVKATDSIFDHVVVAHETGQSERGVKV
ncbi:MAG: hypothetical protein ACO38N_06270, partial [Candidatus Nanopelagicales bacterium]